MRNGGPSGLRTRRASKSSDGSSHQPVSDATRSEFAFWSRSRFSAGFPMSAICATSSRFAKTTSFVTPRRASAAQSIGFGSYERHPASAASKPAHRHKALGIFKSVFMSFFQIMIIIQTVHSTQMLRIRRMGRKGMWLRRRLRRLRHNAFSPRSVSMHLVMSYLGGNRLWRRPRRGRCSHIGCRQILRMRSICVPHSSTRSLFQTGRRGRRPSRRRGGRRG